MRTASNVRSAAQESLREISAAGGELIAWFDVNRRLVASGPMYHRYHYDRWLHLGRLAQRPRTSTTLLGEVAVSVPRSRRVRIHAEPEHPNIHPGENPFELSRYALLWPKPEDVIVNTDLIIGDIDRQDLPSPTHMLVGNLAVREFIDSSRHQEQRIALKNMLREI